jgi:hypothetical protein
MQENYDMRGLEKDRHPRNVDALSAALQVRRSFLYLVVSSNVSISVSMNLWLVTSHITVSNHIVHVPSLY